MFPAPAASVMLSVKSPVPSNVDPNVMPPPAVVMEESSVSVTPPVPMLTRSPVVVNAPAIKIAALPVTFRPPLNAKVSAAWLPKVTVCDARLRKSTLLVNELVPPVRVTLNARAKVTRSVA